MESGATTADAATTPKTQPYVEISQVDDDSSGANNSNDEGGGVEPTTKPRKSPKDKEPSDQAYVEVSQVDDDSSGADNNGGRSVGSGSATTTTIKPKMPPNEKKSSDQSYVEVSQVGDDSSGASNDNGEGRDVELGSATTTRKRPKEKKPSDQPYVEVSQVDDDSPGAINNNDGVPDVQSDSAKPVRDEDDYRPVVLGTGAQFWTSLVHLLPLTVSGFLIGINIQRWYWYNDGEGGFLWFSDTTNLLQLAAKLYELIVIASLGALTLKVFKRRLVESHLPLGLLTGAYRIGDVNYIFSRYFWLGLGSSGWFLMLLIFVNTMLATLVGPSSAILLIPEADWFPLRNAFNNIQLPVFYYNMPVERTWPRVVGAPVGREAEDLRGCDGLQGWFAYWCPSGAFADLYNWLAEWESSDLGNGLVSQDPTGIVRRRLSVKEKQGSGMAIMTTVSLPPLLTVGRLLNFMKSDNLGAIQETPKFRLSTSSASTIFQPLVQSQCAVYTRETLLSSGGVPMYKFGQLFCLGDPVCEDMLKENFYIDSNIWNVTNITTSAGFAAPNPGKNYPLFANAAYPYLNGSTVSMMYFACSIIAHWMPAKLSLSPSESDLVQSNVTDSIDVFYGYLSDPPSNISFGPAIRIESGWLDYMFPRINLTLAGEMDSLSPLGTIVGPLQTHDSVVLEDGTKVRVLAPVGDLNTDDGFQYSAGIWKARSYVQKMFTGMVTEALARVGSHSGSYVVRSYNHTAAVVANIGAQESSRNETVVRADGKIRIDGELGNTVREDVGDFNTPLEFVDRLSELTRLEFDVERYGYGSGKPGPTLNFALAVIYAYLGVLAIYFFHVMVVSKLWLKSNVPTIKAWGDQAELLLLAWNSKPNTRLKQTSVNVAINKWNMEVGIRADSTGQTQLVTGNQGVELLRRNERYN